MNVRWMERQGYNCTPANFEVKVTEVLERITRFT